MSASARHSDIARRYATALFDLANEQGQVDALEKDLRAIATLAATSPDFSAFAANTTLSRKAQAQAVDALAAHLSMGDLAKKFLGMVAANRRLPDVGSMAEAALDLIAEQKGETTATVVSASALDDAQTKQLTAQLSKLTGLKVRLDAQVDASLIGGLVIRVGALRIDNSVKTKLERLHRALTNQTASTDSKQMKEVA